MNSQERAFQEFAEFAAKLKVHPVFVRRGGLGWKWK
jgi:hypothetical protein